MARDKITIFEPFPEASKSVSGVAITPQAITVANGIEISNALENKDNSLTIIVANSEASSDTKAQVVFKASDVYPNACGGDLVYGVTKGAITAITVEDISRFENKDKSIYIDFGTGFTGTIYAVAKHSGIRVYS